MFFKYHCHSDYILLYRNSPILKIRKLGSTMVLAPHLDFYNSCGFQDFPRSAYVACACSNSGIHFHLLYGLQFHGNYYHPHNNSRHLWYQWELKKRNRILSKPQPNLNTTVGLTMKMTLHTPPTHHHTNFSGTSRRARELKFGTDTH